MGASEQFDILAAIGYIFRFSAFVLRTLVLGVSVAKNLLAYSTLAGEASNRTLRFC
jgi:hypothetical protein